MGNGARVSNRAVAERQIKFAEKTDKALVEIEDKLQKILEKNHAEIKKHIDKVIAPAHEALSVEHVRFLERLDKLDEFIKKAEGKQLQDSAQIDRQRDLIDQTNKRITRIILVLKKTPLLKWFVSSKLNP